MENPKVIVCFATEHLEKATQHVNTHNTHLEVGISQEEVIDYALNFWSDSEYLIPIAYSGLFLFPELAGGSEEQLIYTVHISTLISFDVPNSDDIELYELSLDSPEDSEVH